MSTLGQYDKVFYDFINPEFFVKKKEKCSRMYKFSPLSFVVKV